MHYPPTAFSKNGRPTIIARGGAGEEFGATQEPTETDLYELNTLTSARLTLGLGWRRKQGRNLEKNLKKKFMDQVMVMTMSLSSMRTMIMFMQTMETLSL